MRARRCRTTTRWKTRCANTSSCSAPTRSRAELAALRRLALTWMERLAQFRPYLGGAVWHGTATRLSDIYIQLFCDDPKSAEIALIENSVDYEARTVTGFNGEPVEALSLSSVSRELGEADRRPSADLRPRRRARRTASRDAKGARRAATWRPCGPCWRIRPT